MKVAVYCGSAPGVSSIYAEKASELGEALAHAGYGLVYGGANDGLMGKVANAALAANGEVVGVIPTHLSGERAHTALTELHFVDSMHTRKAKMVDLADVFVAMPGGCGTLDEYFEVFTWAQIGLHKKPVILYNVNGFYDALVAHFKVMMDEGFVRVHHQELLKVASTLEELLQYLQAAEEMLMK